MHHVQLLFKGTTTMRLLIQLKVQGLSHSVVVVVHVFEVLCDILQL